MTKKDIKEKLKGICFEIFKDTDFDPDMIEYANFEDDLGMDSVTFISFLIGIESTFEIIIPDELLSMNNFTTFDSTANLIFSVTGKKEEGGETNGQA